LADLSHEVLSPVVVFRLYPDNATERARCWHRTAAALNQAPRFNGQFLKPKLDKNRSYRPPATHDLTDP